ncbi:MAG: hypothetical protein ACXVZO_01035 [Gaiellaceae bacterium]
MRRPAAPAIGSPGGAIRWLPALTAAAYICVVAICLPQIVRSLYWDSDAASALVLGERLRGHGTVSIPHFGWWTSMWWLLATRHLPGHVAIWQGTGYVFAVAAALLVGWATGRVAGRWAGVTAAATALVVGPFALRSLATVAFHVSTSFTTAVLAACLVALAGWRSRAARAAAVATGVVAGLNAASDPLLWIAGIAPFALAAAVLARASRRADVAIHAGVTIVLAAVVAFITDSVMHSLGFRVVSAGIALAPAHLLANTAFKLGKELALLGGADYFGIGSYPSGPLRPLLAILAALAVAATILVVVKQVRRPSSPLALAFACYWGTATVLLCLSFVITTNGANTGAGGSEYLLTLPLAAGAAIGLLAARSRRSQVALAVALALVGGTNAASIAQGRANTAKGTIGTYAQPLTRLLEQKGITRGYAGYWDAQSLTWQSGMRLLVAPVSECSVPSGLCPFNYFTIRSWYDRHPGPSFLIVDPGTTFVPKPPPEAVNARAVYRFGPLSVYLFDYDIARGIPG